MQVIRSAIPPAARGHLAAGSACLAIGVFDVLDPDKVVEYAGAVIVAFITAGSVYAKERLDVAKREQAQAEQNKRLNS